MNIKTILTTTFQILSAERKVNLVAAVLKLRDKYLQLQNRVRQLELENTQLKEQLEREKIKATNKLANKPSSKQAEWEKDSPVDKDKDKDKKKKKGRKRKPRKGAGNRPKDKPPKHTETATVDNCDLCGKDLSAQTPLESTNERIIEDIEAPPEETVVTLVTQQKKYCADCQER